VNPGVLVDTGPLVALLSKNDSRHQECVTVIETLAPPLLTSWPVMTEVAWLLRAQPTALEKLFDAVEGNFLKILELDRRFLGWAKISLRKYHDIEAQLADATLVYLAEREKIEVVFTLDRRDFSVYRTSRSRALKIVPE
jgi:uncharacterized protein